MGRLKDIVSKITGVTAGPIGVSFDTTKTSPSERSRAIYQPLYDDLGNLESALHVLSELNPDFTPALLGQLEKAAEPVCNARKSVSEIGDVDTRHQLDAICRLVELIPILSQQTGGLAGPALSQVIEQLSIVPKLRDRLHGLGCM